MRTLSSESFTRIVAILRDNYGNLQAQMNLKLPADVHEIFSKYTHKLSTNSAEWSVNEPEENDYRPMSEASATERDAIAFKLKNAQEVICRHIGNNIAGIEKLLSVPNQDCIFFRNTVGGEIKVVLTQWGFREVSRKEKIDFIQLLIDSVKDLQQVEVNLNIKYSDGKIAADENLTLDIFGNQIPFKTSSAGTHHAGKIVVGKSFRVLAESGKSDEVITQSDKENYDIVINRNTAYTIIVENQSGKRKANFPLTVDAIPVVTDDNGEYHSGEILLTPEKKITVKASAGSEQSFTLCADRDANRFKYIITEEEKPEESSLTVEVINENNRPMPDYLVNLSGTGLDRTLKTDATGTFTIDRLSAGTKVKLQTVDALAAAEITLQPGENECTLIIPAPKEKQVKIILQNRDGSPLRNTEVKINTAKGSFTATTNSEGFVTLPAANFSHKEKVKLSFSYVKPPKKKEAEINLPK